MKVIILCVFAPLFMQTASASLNRGVWFWYSSTSPYGSSNIVGNAVLEAQTVSFLKARGVKRVYGSYKNRSVDEPGTTAGWNDRLHKAGIQSQILFAEPTWVTNNASLLNKITTRVIGFNTAPGRLATEKFKAVHLDLEPQQLDIWDADPVTNRFLLDDLLNTYIAVRDHLDAAGLHSVGVYADLPVWYDKLPVDGGSVGWADAADRDNWYAAIGVPLAGVSMMAFQRDTFSNIDNGVSYERANIPGATVRTAIQAKVGSGETWPVIADFLSMMDTLETNYGFSGATDIENYRLWREAVAATPITFLEAALEPYPVAGTIGFETTTGATHVVLFSSNLCYWKELHRLKSVKHHSQTNLTVETSAPQGFFKVYRFEEAKRSQR